MLIAKVKVIESIWWSPLSESLNQEQTATLKKEMAEEPKKETEGFLKEGDTLSLKETLLQPNHIDSITGYATKPSVKNHDFKVAGIEENSLILIPINPAPQSAIVVMKKESNNNHNLNPLTLKLGQEIEVATNYHDAGTVWGLTLVEVKDES